MYFSSKNSYEKHCPIRGVGEVCVGDECAMWRWKPFPNPAWKPKSVSEFAAPNDYRLEPPPYIDSDTEGYCGMATRPSFNV